MGLHRPYPIISYRVKMSEVERRAIVQGGDFLPEVLEELKSRGIDVVMLQTNINNPAWKDAVRGELETLDFCSTDLFVGLPSWVDLALTVRNIPVPTPPDYPDCLRSFLYRNVWESTLGDVYDDLRSEKYTLLFIKPAEGAKAFSGTVVQGPVDDMLQMLLDTSIFPLCGPDLPVHCSEVVEMNSEYAVYVVDGEIRKICHYMCKKSSCRCAEGDTAANGALPVLLDQDVVNDVVARLQNSPEGQLLTGYRADFALFKKPDTTEGDESPESFQTGLVEVNDGYVSGRYDDVPVKDFTDMIISRFKSLQTLVE